MPASNTRPSGNGHVTTADLAELHTQVKAAADRMEHVVMDTPEPTSTDENVARFLRVAAQALAAAEYHQRTGEPTTPSEWAITRTFLRIFGALAGSENVPILDAQDAYNAIRLIVAETERISLHD